MTNKLVVINSLKVPKIKILLYEMKLQLPPEPLTRGLPLPEPCPLSTEFVEPHKQNSWVCHCFQSAEHYKEHLVYTIIFHLMAIF